MKHCFYVRLSCQRLDKRKIRLFIAVFENMVEISDRLMVMKRKNQMKFRHYILSSDSYRICHCQNVFLRMEMSFFWLFNIPQTG